MNILFVFYKSDLKGKWRGLYIETKIPDHACSAFI